MDWNKVYVLLCCMCISATLTLAQKPKQKTVINRCSFIEKEAINDKIVAEIKAENEQGE